MSAMYRPIRWGTATMAALFTGAIVYNIFFIQSAMRRHADAGVIVQPDRLGKLVALTGGKPAGSLVRVSVRPDGMEKTAGNAAFTALVLAAQRNLAALGLYDGPANGRYDRKTRAAITAYQKRAGLAVTGRPDQKTLDHMQFDQQVSRAARYTASVRPPASGGDVSFAQYRLAQLGYAPGAIDGKMGARTRKAIRRFQADRGMPVTGRLDAAVLTALRQ